MSSATYNRRPSVPAEPIKTRKPDGWLVGVTIALVVIGILAVFDASYVKAGESVFAHHDSAFYLKRQVLFAVLGAVAFVGGMRIGYWKLRRYAPAMMLGSIALLLMVLIPHIGHNVAGSRRWLQFGPIGFQPSEIAKIVLVVYLAHYLAAGRKRIKSFKDGFLPALIPIGVVCLLVMKEPDMGTMLATATVAIAMLFAGGADRKHILGLIGIAILLVTMMALKEHYRMARLAVFMNPYKDPEGAGYQVLQGLSALGSGGPLGLGLGDSRAKWFYLPGEHTDFIFAIIGEELGLFGTLGILSLFLLLVRRGFLIAAKCRNTFGTLLALGLSMTVGIQAMINIGVVSTLIPNTGVPLPMISFGGTSLVLTLFALGVLADVSRRPVLPWDNEDNDSRSDRRWDRGAHIPGPEHRRSAGKPGRPNPLHR